MKLKLSLKKIYFPKVRSITQFSIRSLVVLRPWHSQSPHTVRRLVIVRQRNHRLFVFSVKCSVPGLGQFFNSLRSFIRESGSRYATIGYHRRISNFGLRESVYPRWYLRTLFSCRTRDVQIKLNCIYDWQIMTTSNYINSPIILCNRIKSVQWRRSKSSFSEAESQVCV